MRIGEQSERFSRQKARRTSSNSTGRTSSDRNPSRLDHVEKKGVLEVDFLNHRKSLRKRSVFSRNPVVESELNIWQHKFPSIREYVRQSAANTKDMQTSRYGAFETHNGLTVPAAPKDVEREIRTPPRCAAVVAGSRRITGKRGSARSDQSPAISPWTPEARASSVAPRPLGRELRRRIGLLRLPPC